MAYALMLYLWVGVAAAVCTAPHPSVTATLRLVLGWPIIALREWGSPERESRKRGADYRAWLTGDPVSGDQFSGTPCCGVPAVEREARGTGPLQVAAEQMGRPDRVAADGTEGRADVATSAEGRADRPATMALEVDAAKLEGDEHLEANDVSTWSSPNVDVITVNGRRV